MEAKEQRKVRTYRATDSEYSLAAKYVSSYKQTSLSSLLELKVVELATRARKLGVELETTSKTKK